MAKVDLGVVKDIPVVLFSGDTTSSVTLSETAANFSRIDICYVGYSSRGYMTLPVYDPNNKSITLSIVEDGSDASGSTRLRRSQYKINGTSIALLGSSGTPKYYPGFTEIKGSTITQNVSGNVIHIIKVIGYR